MAHKIQRFTDLKAWKHSHHLALLIYKLSKSFPEEEKFGLTNQCRRAAVSITSNIAEGFSRSTNADERHFCITAKASLTEVENQMYIARDLHYISHEDFDKFHASAIQVHKLVSGLIKWLSTKST